MNILKLDNCIEVMLQPGHKKLLPLGQKLEATNPDAYMNGYNWDALLRYYLKKNAPDILKGMDTDPEAGLYVAYWPLTEENEDRARRLSEIIRSLIEHEEEICRIVDEHGGEIEWD